MIYVAMSGAKHILGQQAAVAHNLANVSTNGYRAAASAFRAVPVQGDGLPTRAFVVDSTSGANFTPGALQNTGRDLDVALQGPGWIAVQLANGGEAYTRNGSLQVSPNGMLQTRNGLNVLGEGGPISIPPDSTITIAKEGTVSVVSALPPPKSVNAVGRIKLVNPDEKLLARGGDGLFRLAHGGSAEADPKVALVAGALEGSNVNVVEEMISMISLARQFDLQMQLLNNAQKNANQASQILNLKW
ncbi:MAG: flagellar basal-body rod protein FlgF [Betaproteobacteria bacterium]|nr:flagellar basal-body rod protein FlgF [Betaproteobacteria bacterium]